MNRLTKIIGFVTVIIVLLTAILKYLTAKENIAQFERFKQERTRKLEEFNNDLERLLEKKIEKGIPLDKLPYADVSYKGLDLKFDFGYKLYTSEFSGFDIGKYKLSESNSGKALILIMENSLNEFLSEFQYDSRIQLIDTKILGFADGILVKNTTKYDGGCGDLIEVKYYSQDDEIQKKLSLRSGDKMTNEYFALLRAYEIKQYLERMPQLKNNKIELHTKTVKSKGKKFRKVIVEMIIRNAFLPDYKELSEFDRKLYENNWIKLN